MVLARENPDFYGNAGQEAGLISQWKTGRLPQALLLLGPKGIGKSTLAYRTARLLIGGEEAVGNTVHPTFRRISQGAHPDVMVVDIAEGEKEITVDQIRPIINFLRLTPAESSARVVLVDNANLMNLNAANALLKILEEPPAHVLFLPVMHAGKKLLPTLRSRCHIITLKPLAESEMDAVLKERIDESARTFAKAMAPGLPGIAEMLCAEAGPALYKSLLETLQNGRIIDLLGVAEKASQAKQEQAWQVFRLIFERALTRLIQFQTGTLESPLALEQAHFPALARKFSTPALLEMLETSRTAFAECEAQNLDRRSLMVSLFTSLPRAA